MSITNNGAPMGTDGITALASTDSWATPSEYRDPTTGKTYRADTLQELLDMLKEQGVPLFDNEEIRRQGKTTAPKGGKGGAGPSGDDGAQWDRLLIQLQHYPDPEKAREIITEALATPDVSLTRNVGNGRTATKVMKGRRAVLAHEVHHDDERGPHFMAQVHTVALGPDGHISPKWTFQRGEDAKAMVEQVNNALAANGLAPLVFRLRDETGTSVATRKAQLDAAASEEYREAAEKGELPELPDEAEADKAVEALPVSARKESLRQAAQQAGAQAASLYAQAQALQKQNAMYRQALRALEAEEQHLSRIASLNNRLEEAAATAAEAEAQHAAVVAEQAQAVEAARAEVVEVSATLEATQQHAAQVSEQLAETREQLAGVEGELAVAVENTEQLEQRLEQTQGTLATVQETLDAERTARAQEAKAHEADLAEVRAELTQANKDKAGLESRLEKVRSDLADERTAHGAVKGELKAANKRADEQTRRAENAEATATEVSADLAAMREQLAVLQSQAKAQADDLARERKAREDAERMAREAQAATAKAEAQRDARPTQGDLQAALADKAKAEGQRDALRERLEALLAERKPEPGNDNGPKP